MIKDWIAEYKPTNEEETLSALREIMQEIALAGLSRTDFFEKAAFYGGTALRIFYSLDRFSEDLDFSLMEKNPDFSLEPYFTAIVTEFEAIGMTVALALAGAMLAVALALPIAALAANRSNGSPSRPPSRRSGLPSVFRNDSAGMRGQSGYGLPLTTARRTMPRRRS